MMHATAKLAKVGLGVSSSAASTKLKNLFLAGLLAAASSWAAAQRGYVVGWGGSFEMPYDQRIPADLGEVVAISAGLYDNLAIRPDGTVVCWGENTGYEPPRYRPVPPEAHGAVAIEAADEVFLALKPDGTVVSWGRLAWPPPPDARFVAVSCFYHDDEVGLCADGTVIPWGFDIAGFPMPPGLTNVIAVSSGMRSVVALKADGTVVAWGWMSPPPPELCDPNTAHVTAISAGYLHCLALRADGTVVAWGDNQVGQIDVPAGLTDVVAVAAGAFHSVALKADGTVVCWGSNASGQCDPPPGLTNVIAVSANWYHTLAIVASPSPRQIKTQVRDDLIALRATATSDLAKFDAAINYLNKSLEPSRWLDDWHPKPGKAGDGVFNNEKNAISQMVALVPKYPAVQPLIDTLVSTDRRLAEIAIEDAIARGGNPSKIATAQNYLAKGDADVAAGKPAAAIDDYKNAWKTALGA